MLFHKNIVISVCYIAFVLSFFSTSTLFAEEIADATNSDKQQENPSKMEDLEKRIADLEAKLAAKNGNEVPKNVPDKDEKDTKKVQTNAAKWTQFIKPDLKAFLYYKLDATDINELSNEFGVARAYFGAKIKPINHLMFRLTFDAKARIKTAKSGDDDPQVVDVTNSSGKVIGTAEVPTKKLENSEGAYGAYLKYAYAEIYDIGVKGLYVRLGQSGFIGITQIEDFWGYRYQGPVLLDREKFMSSTYIGFSLGYKAPNKKLNIQLSAVNGEGYSHPENQRSKDGHLSIFSRPWAGSGNFFNSLVFGATAVYGKYDDISGTDRRVRAGGVFGFSEKLYCLFTELDFVQDPTSEANSRAAKVAGVDDTGLALSSDEITSGFVTAVYGWIDFGLFSNVIKGLRIVGRYDHVNASIDFADDEHDRFMIGAGYVFNKHFEFLLNYETTIFGDKAGYDSDKKAYFKPDTDKMIYLHVQAKL